jgi:hypothetical protein
MIGGADNGAFRIEVEDINEEAPMPRTAGSTSSCSNRELAPVQNAGATSTAPTRTGRRQAVRVPAKRHGGRAR